MSEKNFIDSFIESIQCPICYLAMVPPFHTPMIIPECGHTFCETCISSLNDCPFCHQKFTKPVKNILIHQIIDSANQNHLIPPELNPPPPSINKLVPKIEAICTYSATDKTYGIQKWYQCRTCNISGNCGFCEICAKICHKGHDVVYQGVSQGFYCDCPDLCKCVCMPKASDLRCTFEISYGTPIEQPMFQCLDCNITGDYYICQNCAIKCHNGHKLQYYANVKNKHCRCFDQFDCKIAKRTPLCTFISSGKNAVLQPKYICKTCGIDGDKCCCAPCAHHCHRNHRVEFVGFSSCSCSCSSDSDHESSCKIKSYNDFDYLTKCPNFGFERKNTSKQQRMYRCLTCGVNESAGICEACAINCHVNHSIEYVGIKNFACMCYQSGNCIMQFCPTLHNDRNECDRKALSIDDVSACYTCLTCDSSGKRKMCETCALKKHANHKIHLLGYMKFECNSARKRVIHKPVVSPA